MQQIIYENQIFLWIVGILPVVIIALYFGTLGKKYCRYGDFYLKRAIQHWLLGNLLFWLPMFIITNRLNLKTNFYDWSGVFLPASFKL